MKKVARFAKLVFYGALMMVTFLIATIGHGAEVVLDWAGDRFDEADAS